nr:tyrosine-type recombinase/integrase [Tepidibacter mesophilus]
MSRVINYKLGINFNFHSLRHTYATILLEAGANIKDIQTRLDHNKLSTTMNAYLHATSKMNEDSSIRFE